MRGSHLVIAVLALASAGCASLDFGSRSAGARDAAGVGEYFAVRLEAGREHLKQGNLTKAIEAFRQASYNPATAPEALNGMGVAYSMMGRNDVARGLFERAIEKDPVDQRYWRNLARVDDQIMLAKALPASGTVTAEAAPALAQAAAPAQPAAASRVQAASLRTTRARETFITTAAANGNAVATTPVTVTRRVATLPPGITIEGRPRSNVNPVRIEVSSANKPAVALRPSVTKKAYPIRIALDTK
jgi:tetratricopeptide (TPR) repeat protein